MSTELFVQFLELYFNIRCKALGHVLMKFCGKIIRNLPTIYILKFCRSTKANHEGKVLKHNLTFNLFLYWNFISL